MKLFFRKFGSPQESGVPRIGSPLIILHGVFGMSDNWTTHAKQFGETGFETFAFDIRNHGQSPHSDEFSYELMVNDVTETLNDLGLNSVFVMGHSMGGKVAMLLALNHPNLVKKLIVVDMAPKYYPPHHQFIFRAVAELGDLSTYSSRKEVEHKLAELIPNESTRQFLLKNLYWKKTNTTEQLDWRFNISAIEKNIEDMGITLDETSPDAIHSTPYLSPSLFIKGEKSTYITSGDEPEIKKLFPAAIFKTIAGAGHWVHADKPKEFFEIVLDFLN